jgi:hypothetical protein
MRDAFQFQVGWRTYRCRVERQPGTDAWWWFEVTGDGHRHAPFRARSGDTEESVREAILAYHSNHLARREAPPPPRHQAGRPPKPKVVQPGAKVSPGASASAK